MNKDSGYDIIPMNVTTNPTKREKKLDKANLAASFDMEYSEDEEE